MPQLLDTGGSLASMEPTYLAAKTPAAPPAPPGARPGRQDAASIIEGENQPAAGGELLLAPVLLVMAPPEL